MQPMREMPDGSVDAGATEPFESKRMAELLDDPDVREVRVFRTKPNRARAKSKKQNRRKQQKTSRRKNR